MKKILSNYKILQKVFVILLLAAFSLPTLTFAQPIRGTFGDTSGTRDGGSVDDSGNIYDFQTLANQNPATTQTSNTVSCPKNFGDIPQIFDYITCTISNSLMPLLFSIAMLVFIWGVVRYVISPDGSEDRERGRSFMVYGVIGLFVMVAVWGLVAIISNTFEINTEFPPQFPE